MSLQGILKASYFSVIISLVQESEASLTYYGPMVRGWLGDALNEHILLREAIFKNPHVDVRPYFLFTKHSGNCIEVNLKFIGFSRSFLKDLIQSLESKTEGHLGGIPCKIRGIKLSEERMHPLTLGKRVRIDFSSPLALEKGGDLLLIPTMNDIVRSLIRSVNRFCKYYLKSCYPVHVPQSLLEIQSSHINSEISPFLWEHRNLSGRIIPLKGITGYIEFEVDGAARKLGSILGLAQVFQIGKWVNYGFGKIEVDRLGS
ncbi:MAG: CRISPR system precrRNA processing endoribonuclease RAMP protein Cas6 [Methanomassiliicoccales archaeon]